MRALFTFTIFLGSLLLFLVQPLIAKMILPYFGGVPAVWNTSLVFFQAALLAGYAYSHFGPKLLGPKVHLVVHVGLLAASVIFMPFAIAADFNPMKSGLPLPLSLLAFLVSTVGLPYFVVSTGAPLLQKWFSRTNDPDAKDPYFLYAASNIGSMIALLSYPFWFEFQFRLAEQANIYKWAFMLLAICVVACGLVSLKTPQSEEKQVLTDPPNWAQKLRWLVLAAVPTSLLLGVTNYLTTNIASIPLLWVVPLALYLLTFILAFRKKPLLDSTKWGRFTALLLAPIAIVLLLQATEPFIGLGILHLVVFFFAASMCHTELAETRPAADHLTEFYLWMSLGGVVGGAFNAFLAPVLFVSIAEYPIALVAILALRAKKEDPKWNLRDTAMVASIVFVTVGAWLIAQGINLPANNIRTAVTLGIPGLLCFLMIDRPLRYAAATGAFFLCAHLVGVSDDGKNVLAERSFFGIHRITEPTGRNFRQLAHGNTVHGRQNLDPKYQNVPMTYYHPTGPIGETILELQKTTPIASYGFVGLGIGSLAAYGRIDDKVTFFEIDPLVIESARNPAYFTFLENCKSELDIVEGDARLSLRDQPDGSYDLIALDAFSSDSIPMHLLTIEAFQMYMSKLKPSGVLAVHISNRYLNLKPMLSASAKEMGLAGIGFEDHVLTDEDYVIGKSPSNWVLLAPKTENFGRLTKFAHWEPLDLTPPSRSWTDDRSNLLEAWKKGD